MSKGLFDIIFKLRPLAKRGEITRDQALEMLQGSGATSAQMETAVQNLFKNTPVQESGTSGGITSFRDRNNLTKDDPMGDLEKIVRNEGDVGLPRGDNFDTILNNLGTLEELNDESLQALARESKVLGNSIKQLENMRDNSEEYVLMTNRKKKIDSILDVANMIPRSKNTSFEDSLESWKRANKDRSLLISTREEEKFMNERFDYERAQYQQALQKKLQPFYEKYGAKTKADKKFIEDFYDVDVDEGATLKKNNSSYMFVDVRTYLDEATENILGISKDLRTDILYGREASKYVNSQDIKGFIKYAKQRFLEEGVAINDKMLNKVVDDMYIMDDVDDAFATGGRVGFKKGLSQALIDQLNKIAPGSTKIGKTSKEMSEKGLRREAERELTKDFNRLNTKLKELETPSNTKIIEREEIKVDIGTLKEFYDDFIEAGGNPNVKMKDLKQAYNLKKSYPFNTPFVDKDGKLIGQEATQKMYPESKKFYIEDPDVLAEEITAMREGRIPRTKEGERQGLDIPPVPEGFKLSKEKLMRNFPEIDEDFADEIMKQDKQIQGRLIKMMEDRRRDPELYDKLMEKYGNTLQFQGEFDKAVRRKKNASGGLNYLMGLD